MADQSGEHNSSGGDSGGDTGGVRSVQRAIDILGLLTETDPAVSISEIVRATGLAKTLAVKAMADALRVAYDGQEMQIAGQGGSILVQLPTQLQTLAVIERRVADDDIARLAREQERELREYLFGADRQAGTRAGDLATSLRAAAARYEDAFGGRVEVLIADDLPRVQAPEALVGAVGEALTNAGKHGHASRVTVFVEPGDDGGVFCSVKDDGRGFDPTATVYGTGLQGMADRLEAIGGTLEVVSAPGRGTTVGGRVPVGERVLVGGRETP